MKINLFSVWTKMVHVFRKFPVEALLGVFFFVLFWVQDQSGAVYEQRQYMRDVLALFPAFMVLTYALHQLSGNKMGRLLYFLSVLFPIPFLWVDLHHLIDFPVYPLTLILSLFVLLASKWLWDNTSFARNSVQTFVDLAISLFIGITLAFAVWGIYASVVYIFGFDYQYDFPEYLFMFSFFVVVPLLFCHQQAEVREEAIPRFMDIIISYILSPAVIIYTGILYLYFIVIVIHWELPKGKIAYMVLAFVLFAMAGHMLQLVVRKNFYGWFYKHFSLIAIPPLLIFWVATSERVSNYGLTESRVYLLAGGLLMTIYILLLLIPGARKYQWMALVSSILIVLMTYIPGINARSIGIYAQEGRLEKYIAKLDMRDSQTGKLKTGIHIESGDPLRQKEAGALIAAYDYLKQEAGREFVEKKYGVCDISGVEIGSDYKYISSAFEKEVNTDEYPHYLPFRTYTYTLEKGFLTVSKVKDNRELLRFDIDAYINARRNLLLKEVNDYTSQQLFVVRDDSLLILLDGISLESSLGTYRVASVSVEAVFSK